MAKIIRNVDDVNKISSTDFLCEIECIEFIDDKGRRKQFKIFGIVPLSTDEFNELDKEVDWDDNNFHFAVDVGDEIK